MAQSQAAAQKGKMGQAGAPGMAQKTSPLQSAGGGFTYGSASAGGSLFGTGASNPLFGAPTAAAGANLKSGGGVGGFGASSFG